MLVVVLILLTRVWVAIISDDCTIPNTKIAGNNVKKVKDLKTFLDCKYACFVYNNGEQGKEKPCKVVEWSESKKNCYLKNTDDRSLQKNCSDCRLAYIGCITNNEVCSVKIPYSNAKEIMKLKIGTSLLIACDSGYKLVNGNNLITCQQDKIIHDVPECKKNQCTADIAYSVDGKVTLELGETREISCKTGYIVKVKVVKCNEMGELSTIPICEPDCNTSIEHAQQSELTLAYREKTVVRCLPGFRLKRFKTYEKEITCEEGGKLSEHLTCERVPCTKDSWNTLGILDSKVLGTLPVDYLKYVEFECKSGFSTLSERKVNCSENGQFGYVGNKPVCHADCEKPVIEHGNVTEDRLTHGTFNLTVICKDGAGLSGEATGSCYDGKITYTENDIKCTPCPTNHYGLENICKVCKKGYKSGVGFTKCFNSITSCHEDVTIKFIKWGTYISI